MTDDLTTPQGESTGETTPEPNSEITALVKLEMPDASDDVIQETAAFFHVIKKRIQTELDAVGEITNEVYHRIVSEEIQHAIAQNKSIAQEKVDTAVKLIKQEADKNWAVMDAIKSRALAQVQGAGKLTRTAYLDAVAKARKAVAENQLIEPDRIEEAVKQIQRQADKNWHGITHEFESFGQRIQETAKTAWHTLTSVFHKKNKNKNPEENNP
jgi:signal recognition particle GTPase